ncbi:acyltransferase [Niabella terrae]
MVEPAYFVHHSAIIDKGAIIGHGTKIWHFTHIMPTAQIGTNCNLGQNVFIGDRVIVGNNVKIQNNVSLYEGIICEDEVFIGPSAVFTNIINPRSSISRKNSYKNTILRKGATIGANATLICGIEIGVFSFIGAGAVVTKDVPDYALVVGNPAKQIGWMSQQGEKLDFSSSDVVVCKNSGVSYRLKGNKVLVVEKLA